MVCAATAINPPKMNYAGLSFNEIIEYVNAKYADHGADRGSSAGRDSFREG